MRANRLVLAGLLLAISWPVAKADAGERPISMISYEGQQPVALPYDDPLSQSIGLLFIDSPAGKKFDPETEGYATAFLISECHALTGTASISTLPATQRMPNQSTVIVDGLTLGIGLKSGYEPATLSRESFSATWPVTIRRVIPDSANRVGSMLSSWWLLQLEGCTPGAAGNGTPLAFDPTTSLELYAMGLPVKARHVGILMKDQLALTALPSCDILGQIRNIAWESTCSSWLGMHGGPAMIFDETRKAWVAIGMIPLGNPAIFLNPRAQLNSRGRSYAVYSVSATNPRFFDYTTNIVPMARIWPWIRDELQGDRSGLVDPRRTEVEEPEMDIRQLLLMQMQQRPEKDWSAADFTRFAIALRDLKYNDDAAEMLKSAVMLDPTYLPAAFHLSKMIGSLEPWGITDKELATLKSALGSAVDKYPEDAQLILSRLHVEERMAEFDHVIEDGEAFVSASPFGAPDWLFIDRGDAFLAVGDLDKAEADFVHAIELDATNSEAVRGLARIKLYRGEIADGLRLAEKAVRLDRDSKVAGLLLALARAQAGDVDGAVAEAERVRVMSSNTATYALWAAVLRAYKRGMAGETVELPLLPEDDLAGASDDHWSYQMAEVYLGVRPLESLSEVSIAHYIPSYRRVIGVGRVAFSAVFDLAQGKSIGYHKVEEDLLTHRDTLFAHLAPLLKNWNARVKGQQ